jgi:hypothetical protein
MLPGRQVTYRSVIMALLGAALIFGASCTKAFPKFTDSTVKAAANLSSGLLEKVAGLAPPLKGPSAAVSQQAHFTALDGTIRVRKGNGNSWINADYNVPLEKGDVVQTGSEGMAKIVFNDGTNYTVKQDSLIVIEENSANDQQQTNVSVAVTTGTVDLTTATYVQGSKSQVIVAGAKASLAPDSAAMVHNDPKDDQHEILVKKGSGEIERNGEVVQPRRLGKSEFPERLENHGAGHGNRSARAHHAGQHDAGFHQHRGEGEGSGVCLDAHGERRRIPVAHFAQSVFFVVAAG